MSNGILTKLISNKTKMCVINEKAPYIAILVMYACSN